MSGDDEGQLEARSVVAALEKADGLVVHAHCVGQLLSADAAFGPQLGDAVVEAAFAWKSRMRSVVLHDIILR